MKTKQVTGAVYDTTAADKRRLVTGYAFQTPKRRWMRMWATPSIESFAIFNDEWIVSHWDTGARVTDYGKTFRTPQEAIKDALQFIATKTDAQIKEALHRWVSGESWPGK